jgi:acetyl-CoA synthetase
VILRGSHASRASTPEGAAEVQKELRDHVGKEIGPIAKPKKILVVQELPKTRSGKIMRRLLRDVAEHRELGDTTTLADPTVVEEIKGRAEAEASKED